MRVIAAEVFDVAEGESSLKREKGDRRLPETERACPLLGFGAFCRVADVLLLHPADNFTERQSVERDAREGDPTAAYLAPLMALLVIILVTGAFSIGIDWFYPVRVLGTASRDLDLLAKQAAAAPFGGHLVRQRYPDWCGGLRRLAGAGNGLGNTETGSVIPGSLAEMPAGLAAAWLIFRALGSVITVPIAEELAFRGYALRRLISSDFDKLSPRFTWLSFLLSSVLFGALHGRWLAGTVAGMFYAWAMYRRGRVSDAILAHATTNALIAAEVLFFGNWTLWN